MCERAVVLSDVLFCLHLNSSKKVEKSAKWWNVHRKWPYHMFFFNKSDMSASEKLICYVLGLGFFLGGGVVGLFSVFSLFCNDYAPFGPKECQHVNESHIQSACRAQLRSQKTPNCSYKREERALPHVFLMYSTAQLSQSAAFTMRITIQPH